MTHQERLARIKVLQAKAASARRSQAEFEAMGFNWGIDYGVRAGREAFAYEQEIERLKKDMGEQSSDHCENCGKPAKHLILVKGRDGACMRVGSECARHFKRADVLDRAKDFLFRCPDRNKDAAKDAATKIFHADHGVTNETVEWAIKEIKPTGFFMRTLILPAGHADLRNGLYGPASGDAPVSESEVHYVQRSPDRPKSRMVDKPKRPTRLMTIIGMASGDDVTVYTAYGGPAAEREPGDASLGTDEEKEAAKDFWAKHALASGD